jgi:maltooligosyltrehalose trehalohydrolase
MTVQSSTRRLSAGVEVREGGAHARVWAPACRSVDVVIEPREGGDRRASTLAPDGDGFFAGTIEATTGDRYWFRLDGTTLRPDPVSRYQPAGPHGPSAIVDPTQFRWTDHAWRGVSAEGQVIYEMHVGTFTQEGTWRAAMNELSYLADLGITVIEMMPVAEFAGRFGWGYDGVDLYAPTHLYGEPDHLREFVNRAHELGVGVILDVVYNHLGPDGNYLSDFSADYFNPRYQNDWGQALNFEGPAPARDFFVENAGYWIDEFHFDGLRLDATQDIHDASREHVILSIVRRAREAAPGRQVYIVAENEPQRTRLVRRPSDGGFGGNALWNDDYHHTAVVALTGRREAYYRDYKGSAQEFVSCAKYGYLYQGQWYSWQKKRRGEPGLDLCPHAFVAYLENHDQIANTPFGARLHTLASPARLRALTALTLLGPATPMLFQGQEFASSAPFLYFADHKPELNESIGKGRRAFLSQFPSVSDPEVLAALPSPVEEAAFERSTLDLRERERHAAVLALHRDLIQLRRSDPVIRAAGGQRPDGAVLGPETFLIRYTSDHDGDRLLILNLGCDLDLHPVPEPLLAPPAESRWRMQWSSASPKYGGQGTPPVRPHSHLHIPGESAVLLRSERGPIEDDGEEIEPGKTDDGHRDA